MVEVQKGGARRPLFFLHGDFSGGGFYCVRLARHLGEEQPFYALSPHGLDGRESMPTIEAMAAAHLVTVRACQPEGPYRLGGYCNGGLVAYEMARLLHAQGQKVELVAIVHASARNVRFAGLRRLVSGIGSVVELPLEEQLDLFVRFRAFTLRLGRLPRRERAGFVLAKIAKVARRLARRAFAGGSRGPLVTAPGSDRASDREAVNRTYYRAVESYIPRPYPGSVRLFWPVEERVDARDPSMGWRSVAQTVEIDVVPGDHVTCVTEHVGALAGRLRECLARADEGTGPSR
jgi:thioesterase domain-containing protein